MKLIPSGILHPGNNRGSPDLAQRRTACGEERRPLGRLSTRLCNPHLGAHPGVGLFRSSRICRDCGSSGTEITVYKDRLQRFLAGRTSLGGVAAGYVLAHDLAHAMQGAARHSESGILKPNWSSEDCQARVFHKLAFSPLDIELIHRGLAVQRARRRSETVILAESVSPAVFNLSRK